MRTLGLVTPTEDIGRETLSRYDMQFQAAAYATLEILEGKGVERVFCDYHDDFVIRKIIDGVPRYHFFQVKTKGKLNAQWSSNEVFALHKRLQKANDKTFNAVLGSFAGKLLLHCINFNDACAEVTLLSNVFFDDQVVDLIGELQSKNLISKHSQFLANNFSAIFTQEPTLSADKISDILSKISLAPAVDYIGKNRTTFANAARAAIFKYSEIDLNHYETTELANGLVDLVYGKSRASIKNIPLDQREDLISVSLDDLLKILSISRASYDALLDGVEPNALKAASVIQRWLQKAGASDEMIEYASRKKVSWDIWYRNARHIYSPLNLQELLAQIDKVYERWLRSEAGFDFLNNLLEELKNTKLIKSFSGLTTELLFGAVGSTVVRRSSR